ncbi:MULTISPECIES: hypothetical protein [unclassified Arthrobacter]|uniref:hypothetical protein n=1 Tax=unclassified Arthrobacter TaxID=235627 RepID=UPI0033980DAD
MREAENRPQLPLIPAASGCSCCSPAAAAPAAVVMADGGARDGVARISAAPNTAADAAERR